MGLSNVFGKSAGPRVGKNVAIPARPENGNFEVQFNAFFEAMRERCADVLGESFELRFVAKDNWRIVKIYNRDTLESNAFCFVHTGNPKAFDGDGARFEGFIFKAMNESAALATAQTKHPKTGDIITHPNRQAVGSIWTDNAGMEYIRDDMRGVVGTRG